MYKRQLWALGQRLVRKGEFDKYLARPINPLFHILVETFQIDALGELLVGGILLGTTVTSISWTLPKFLLFLVCIPFAILIYTSLKIATASIAFWTKQSGAMIYIFYMFNDFAKYPISIYNSLLRWLISFIVPVSYTHLDVYKRQIWMRLTTSIIIKAMLLFLALKNF